MSEMRKADERVGNGVEVRPVQPKLRIGWIQILVKLQQIGDFPVFEERGGKWVRV